jgi:ribosomal protein L37AE/L43A
MPKSKRREALNAFHIMLDMAHILQERRNFLCKNFKQKCPVCRSNQIQLIDQNILAKWKCRECHHKFTFEPLKNDTSNIKPDEQVILNSHRRVY